MAGQRQTQFTQQMDEYLKRNAQTQTYTQLQSNLFSMFGKLIAVATISEHCRKHLNIPKKPASFCPDRNAYHSNKPIGSERIEKNRVVMVKVAQPNVWVRKTELVLGKIPKSKQVIFLDGDSLNVTKENMVVVDKRVHARLAKNGWLGKDKEIVLTAIKWAELLYAIQEVDERRKT